MMKYTKKASLSKPGGIVVWDLPLRLFHWSLLLVVSTGLITGFLGPESWLVVHIQAGYALLYLLVFRLFWAFSGSYYSRVTNFPLSISQFRVWFRQFLQRRSDPEPGHNPAAAWMVLLIVLILTLMLATGIILQGSKELTGITSSITNYEQSYLVGSLHKLFAWILVATITIHISAVAVHELWLRHPVLAAMIHGRKLADTLTPVTENPRGYKLVSLVLALLVSSSVWAVFQRPVHHVERWYDIAQSTEAKLYEDECGACHHALHPSLNAKENWSRIMDSLQDHFGDDASLDQPTEQRLLSFLSKHNSLNFDTEVAWEIGRRKQASLQITDSKYWKDRHREIPATTFESPPVFAAVNCNQCHQDAGTGLFADKNIQIPEEVRNEN